MAQLAYKTSFQGRLDADETAITRRLPPVPTRRRSLGHVPRDFAAIIGGALLLAGVALVWSGPPVNFARESFASEAVETLAIAAPVARLHVGPRSEHAVSPLQGVDHVLDALWADEDCVHAVANDRA
ncbi:MAG: hypothetical protein AAF721_07835, partial [Myxococcota bacterium]